MSLPQLVGCSSTPAAAQQQPTIKTTRLSDDLLMFEGAGGNVVALHGSEGVLMVDGGLAAYSSVLLERVADESGNRPVKTLLNTHWHWDHTGSNEALAAQGASIIAHENTKLWLGTQVISEWEQRIYPPRPQALPNQTFFYDSKQMSFGNRSIEYGYLPQAHTDGDIYVLFPTDNVLVAGDVVSGGDYPIVDYSTTGWIGGMITALRELLKKTDANTRIIPGTGPVRTKADLQAQLEMCLTVISRISESYYKGHTWEELVASKPTREFDERWGNPDLFLHTAYESAWVHITEIRRIR